MCFSVCRCCLRRRKPAGVAPRVLFGPILRDDSRGVVQPFFIFRQLEERAGRKILVLHSLGIAQGLKVAKLHEGADGHDLEVQQVRRALVIDAGRETAQV